MIDYNTTYSHWLNILKDTQKYRTFPKIPLKKTSIDFSTNDYLNLSNSPIVIEATCLATKSFGVGSTGSRLLSGNSLLVEALEKKIAQDKKTADALVFNTGYQANLSVLPALCHRKVLKLQALVFFDKLNHASLYQAVFLSKGHLIRYRHNCMDDLKKLLRQYQHDKRPKFIVSETLYGMDGDVVDIATLVQLAAQYNALLYLDESHATGILGIHGYGLSTTIDMQHIPHVVMGTFSKGLGCFGAYIACSILIKRFLINQCTGLIYSTALPPMVIAAAAKSWAYIHKLDQARKQLLTNAQFVRQALQALGWDIGNSTTHIVPIIVGTVHKTMQLQAYLDQQGIHVSAIRPPSVPPNKSRLRIALTCAHSEEDINKLLQVMEKAKKIVFDE